MPLETIGRAKLQRAFKRRQITQADLGGYTEAAQSTVSGWATGLGRPDAMQRAVLWKLLGIAPVAWFTREERERLRGLRRLRFEPSRKVRTRRAGASR